jgi:predicted MFS family arabinose efflux permease
MVGAGAAIGGVIGGAAALRWKPARPLVPAFLLIVVAQVQLLLLIPPFPAVVVAGGALLGVAAVVVSNTLWETMLQQHIPAEALSRVSSYDWMFSLVFQPIAFAMVGPVSQAVGISQTLGLVTALGVVVNTGVLLVPSVRNLRRLEAASALPSPEAAAAGEPTEPPLATSA